MSMKILLRTLEDKLDDQYRKAMTEQSVQVADAILAVVIAVAKAREELCRE